MEIGTRPPHDRSFPISLLKVPSSFSQVKEDGLNYLHGDKIAQLYKDNPQATGAVTQYARINKLYALKCKQE